MSLQHEVQCRAHSSDILPSAVLPPPTKNARSDSFEPRRFPFLDYTHSLLNLLRLQPYSLPIHKDPLSFIRLRLPPRPDLRSELLDIPFIRPLQQDPCRLRRARFHALRNAQLHGVRVPELQIYELLRREGRGDGCGGGLDCRAVADTDEAEDGDVAFGDAGNGVLEEGAYCSWERVSYEVEMWCEGRKIHTPHCTLVFLCCVVDGHGEFASGFVVLSL